ncbi:MAG TPA: PEP-utilizing enzyme [Acidimicrobiales bacterium]|nr:PEP-utilizing enzyme [Acidimicrobiales bacterium]
MELTWEAPGPGTWFAEPEHMPRPSSGLFNDLFPEIMTGWSRGGLAYGLGSSASRAAAVNGVLYFSFDQGAPADPEVKEAARRDRRWLEEHRRWTEEERPAAVADNRALQDLDLPAHEDESLALHVRETIANSLRWAPVHFEHVGRGVVIEMLMDEVAARGLPRDHALDLCAGRSAATTEPSVHVARIAEGLRAAGVSGIVSLDDIRVVPAAAAALDAYLDDYGWRLLHGYDPMEPCLAECPEVVVSAVRAELAGVPRTPVVPPPVPEGLEELAADAGLLYGTRDDDDGICFLWTMGLVRRALLELGARLAARGRLRHPDDVFECDRTELFALLDGAGPPADELARRRAVRIAATHTTWPAGLVDGPTADGPSGGAGPTAPATVGSAAYTGPARVIDSTGVGLDRIEPGDVLVAVTTGPSFNSVFPALGAVAVELGGVSSHTALLARELGIPAVIGVPGLTSTIRSGDVVEVDPVAGTVRVLTA